MHPQTVVRISAGIGQRRGMFLVGKDRPPLALSCSRHYGLDVQYGGLVNAE